MPDPTPPRLAIAICTYNGERHLREQLDSFIHQSRRPDELVVCDDCSNDHTIEILDEFARSAPFSVRIVRNETNLGIQGNFAKAISLCESEIILCSDQDDVWLSEKCNKIEKIFASDASIGLAVSNAEIVDENLKSLGYLHWDGLGFDHRYRRRVAEGHAFQALLQHCPLSGATMAFRRRYVPMINPIPKGWTHDWWIARLIAAVAPIRLIEEPLIQYRQHQTQATSGRKRSLWQFARSAPRLAPDYFQRELDQYVEMHARLSAPSAPPKLPGSMELLSDKIRFCQARLLMRQKRWARLPIIAGQLFRNRYNRCGRGWVTLARDILG
jgi:glycosyltransferase involved in cell wall biosynthesis